MNNYGKYYGNTRRDVQEVVRKILMEFTQLPGEHKAPSIFIFVYELIILSLLTIVKK